ncbi:hypothetical protein [Streptomyces sp. NPDC013187]|uniref:8-oxoguanine DNA glycosylase OGG fold protein n=1 Tax=Streptomyces sp. NPDC013187 TaxID=3364865 RepID=UPI0036A7ECFD
MAARLLPGAVVRALGRWWETHAAVYADGTPGAHTIRYTPGRWGQITPWPKALAPTSAGGDAAVSRAEVASAVADALRREAFREALVATYVWGKGKRGTPGGSGPSTLHKILAFDGLDAALAAAVTALHEYGAPQAYAALQGQVPGLGPAFFTKFLYFTGIAMPPARGPRPLILDRVLSRRLRQLAVRRGPRPPRMCAVHHRLGDIRLSGTATGSGQGRRWRAGWAWARHRQGHPVTGSPRAWLAVSVPGGFRLSMLCQCRVPHCRPCRSLISLSTCGGPSTRSPPGGSPRRPLTTWAADSHTSKRPNTSAPRCTAPWSNGAGRSSP